MPFPAPDFGAARRHLQDRLEQNGRGPAPDPSPHPIGCGACRTRQRKDLQRRCLPKETGPAKPAPRPSGGFVPDLSDRIERDLRLTDGARRCARILVAYAYRRHRDSRAADITVPYLAKALGKCRRTVQRYLRQLERADYIAVYVVPSKRTRMCLGLLIQLLEPLFPPHHRRKWPAKARNSEVTSVSQINRERFGRRPVTREFWALRCMDGLWDALLRDLGTRQTAETAKIRALSAL